MKMEFLLAHENGTWSTLIVDVPLSLDEANDSEINFWFNENYMSQTQYRKIVFAALYNIAPEEKK